MESRRKFIRDFGLIAGAAGFSYVSVGNSDNEITKRQPTNKKMILRFRPYELQLKHVFTLASGSRTTTPVMLTEIEFDNITGYGEASMPPYLGESHATAEIFLRKVDLGRFDNPFLMEDILSYIDELAPGNYAAKASVDIALHDLVGKIMKQPWYRIWGLNPARTPVTSFTIGIDKADAVVAKTREASPYKMLKVKLGQGNDREMIEAVRSVTNVPLSVDINQGWKNKNEALEIIQWLDKQNVVFVEQPMPKDMTDDIAWVTKNSPLPIIADESFQTIGDFGKVRGVYSGVNIKLMKCGGLRKAFEIIAMARAEKMKVMIGCMTETSCAVTAAAQLSPLVDWADLDGNLLISNDIFRGLEIREGKVILPDDPGIGVRKI